MILLASCAAPPAAPLFDQVGHPLTGTPAERIVALAPDVTEMVFALGGGSRLIAVAPTADYPPQASLLPQVAPSDLEAIVALRPDLVLATTAGNDPRVVSRLIEVGVRTCTLDVTSPERLAEAAALVGRLLGAEAAGEELARSVTDRWTAAARRAEALPPTPGLYVVWWDPLVVAAPGTFHDALLRAAGITNAADAGAGRYPRLDPEMLLSRGVELVVAPDEPDLRAGLARVLARAVGARLRTGALPVVWLPADAASRPGPRLPAALEALVAAREATL